MNYPFAGFDGSIRAGFAHHGGAHNIENRKFYVLRFNEKAAEEKKSNTPVNVSTFGYPEHNAA